MSTKGIRNNLALKELQRGGIGSIFVVGMVALIVGFGIISVGGIQPSQSSPAGQEVKVISPTAGPNQSNLQLQTFGYVTIAPTPVSYGSLCDAGGVNNEPEILVGYSPAQGQSVGATGQVKVWVNDEGAPFVAPGEQVNLSTGAVITHGDTSAKAPDNFLFEPALYIAPNLAESSSPKPFFPDLIKGQFNNNPPDRSTVVQGAPIDNPPAGSTFGPNSNGGRPNLYTAEYIWNVSSLKLSPGTYSAEFVIHDGDRDRGVGCASINIQ